MICNGKYLYSVILGLKVHRYSVTDPRFELKSNGICPKYSIFTILIQYIQQNFSLAEFFKESNDKVLNADRDFKNIAKKTIMAQLYINDQGRYVD